MLQKTEWINLRVKVKMSVDINEQYEKIFGKEHRPNIFSEDDAEYSALLKEIISAKRVYNPRKLYPFSKVELVSYEDFTRMTIVKEMEKKGQRIFYIKRYVGEKLSVYAAGYFDSASSEFVVLRESFGQNTYFSRELLRKLRLKDGVSSDMRIKNDDALLLYKANVQYASASVAASIFLGKNATFLEWRDKRGKSLDAYYSQYKSGCAKAKANVNTNVGDAIIRNMFYIKRDEVYNRACDASAYYNNVTGKFVVCANSLISFDSSFSYAYSSDGAERMYLILNSCVRYKNYYRLTKDTSFTSSNDAASFVMGCRVNGKEVWKDSRGDSLSRYLDYDI